MKIVCPVCTKIQEIIPDELIGKYVRCKTCHNLFLWKDFVVWQQQNQTIGEAKPAKSDFSL